MTVIETQHLTRQFGPEIVAVDDLSFSVQAGEIFGFLGHNGAGKTTTVRLLNGVLGPTKGSISVLGLDPLQDGPALRSRTGVLTETPALEEKLTAREMLEVYGQIYGVDDRNLAGRIAALLGEFQLEARADDYIGGYSKGMRQRLALARTLIHEPQLLFLDEPTSGLDPVGRRDVHELIVRSSRTGGRTVFLCTHDLVEAQRLCDRVGVMEQGRLVALGTPQELARALSHGVQLEITLDAAPPSLTDAPVPPEAHEMTWDPERRVATVRLSTEADVPDLIAALVRAGARIYRVEPQEPTLADVYFALHDQRKREAERL